MRNGLTALANRFGSDKGDRHRNRHAYTRIYGHYFGPMRDLPVTVLEIGLCHPVDPSWRRPEGAPIDGSPSDGGWSGAEVPSLRMWSRWFRKGRIVGFDINDFADVALPPRCEVVQGDSSSASDLAALAALGPFDVIIDDASHASLHQQAALGGLWPSLAPGGLYCIEDLHWQPAALERADVPTTRTLLRTLQVTGELTTHIIAAEWAEQIGREIVEVAMFDSLEPPDLHHGDPAALSDALAVLRKSPVGVTQERVIA